MKSRLLCSSFCLSSLSPAPSGKMVFSRLLKQACLSSIIQDVKFGGPLIKIIKILTYVWSRWAVLDYTHA